MNENLKRQMQKLCRNDKHNNSFLTRRTFQQSMNQFLEFASERHLQKIENISDKSIESFITEKLDDGCSLIYLRKMMSAIRYYNRMACDLRGTESRITITNDQLGISKNQIHYKRGISKEELDSAINLCKDEDFKIMIELGYRLGLRSNELLNLRISTLVDAINRNDYLIHITDGTKGSKQRYVEIDKETRKRLQQILDLYKPYKYVTDKLFCGNEKGDVKKQKERWHAFWNRYSYKIMESAGTEDRSEPLTAHALRRQYARNVFQKLMDSDKLSKMDATNRVSESLGHGKNQKDITAAYLGFKI